MRWCVLVALVGCAGGSPRDPSQEGTDDPAVLALQAEVRGLKQQIAALRADVDAARGIADGNRAELDDVGPRLGDVEAREYVAPGQPEPWARGSVIAEIDCAEHGTSVLRFGYVPTGPVLLPSLWQRYRRNGGEWTPWAPEPWREWPSGLEDPYIEPGEHVVRCIHDPGVYELQVRLLAP